MFSPAKHNLSELLFIISTKATFRDFWKIERDACVGLCSDTEQETALEQEIRHNKWEQPRDEGWEAKEQ